MNVRSVSGLINAPPDLIPAHVTNVPVTLRDTWDAPVTMVRTRVSQSSPRLNVWRETEAWYRSRRPSGETQPANHSPAFVRGDQSEAGHRHEMSAAELRCFEVSLRRKLSERYGARVTEEAWVTRPGGGCVRVSRHCTVGSSVTSGATPPGLSAWTWGAEQGGGPGWCRVAGSGCGPVTSLTRSSDGRASGPASEVRIQNTVCSVCYRQYCVFTLAGWTLTRFATAKWVTVSQ